MGEDPGHSGIHWCGRSNTTVSLRATNTFPTPELPRHGNRKGVHPTTVERINLILLGRDVAGQRERRVSDVAAVLSEEGTTAPARVGGADVVGPRRPARRDGEERSRRSFLTRSALAGGTLLALGGATGTAPAQNGEDDDGGDDGTADEPTRTSTTSRGPMSTS